MRPAVLFALAAFAATPVIAQQAVTEAPSTTGTETKTGAALESAAKPASESAEPAAPARAAEPVGKPAAEAAPQTATEPDAKPAEKAVGESADGVTNETAPPAAAQPAEKPRDAKPPTDSAAESADTPIVTPGDLNPATAETTQAAVASTESTAASLEFRTIIGDKPIEIPADRVTPAFESFRHDGENPFAGDEAALADGKKLYAKLCQACHMPDGSGRIGPSLRDDLWRHPRIETAAGQFEIIHSGGAGAMQAFHHRASIDEILKVMAYIDTFRAN